MKKTIAKFTSTQAGIAVCSMTHTAPNGTTYRAVTMGFNNSVALYEAIRKIEEAYLFDEIPF